MVNVRAPGASAAKSSGTLKSPVCRSNGIVRAGCPVNAYFNSTIDEPVASLGQLRLDGASVADSLFKPIGIGPWASGTIEVKEGAHTIACSAPFGLSCYGFGLEAKQYDAYGNPGGYMVERPAR